MTLINFQKDNIIRLPFTPSSTGWPVCYKCWQPVEAYELADEGLNWEALRAQCSHGGNSVETETKRITMRRRWTEAKKQLERSRLVFFVPNAGVPIANEPGV